MREAKVAYYGLTSFMDDCVGRVLAALDASGQADDTVVLYISDHGDMMGDQGYWTKQVMYEASVGVSDDCSWPWYFRLVDGLKPAQLCLILQQRLLM